MLRQLLWGGIPTELAHHGTVQARDPVELLDDVDGNPDGPRLIGEGSAERLPDPPGRVRGELEAPAILEAIDRLHEADVPFLDEVEQRQLAP